MIGRPFACSVCDPEAFTGIGFGLLTWAATVAEPHPSNGPKWKPPGLLKLRP